MCNVSAGMNLQEHNPTTSFHLNYLEVQSKVSQSGELKRSLPESLPSQTPGLRAEPEDPYGHREPPDPPAPPDQTADSPLERRTMFSRKVFCGATSPLFPPGILLRAGGAGVAQGLRRFVCCSEPGSDSLSARWGSSL